jgi:sortase A
VTICIHWRNLQCPSKQKLFAWAECFLVLVSCLTLGFCALAYLDAGLYQAREIPRFETPRQTIQPGSRLASRVEREQSAIPFGPMQEGSPIGRIDIRRIGVSTVVVEGVKPRSLGIAVGHIPGTALPAERGNVGIAGHRDIFFRNLGEIREGDVIALTTRDRSFEYSVESTQIVDPTNVQVLENSNEPVLTLVTCYPFYYAGPAPLRYIVRARQTKVFNLESSPERP